MAQAYGPSFRFDENTALLRQRLFGDNLQEWDEPIPELTRLWSQLFDEAMSERRRLLEWLHRIVSETEKGSAANDSAHNAIAGFDPPPPDAAMLTRITIG